ncbi:MAG TPA: amidase [Solibacterales bacterium]|nr:amidase [Bryobacterales bacterium]
MDRREFLGATAAATLKTARPARFELEEITIDELARGLDNGNHTARSLTSAYLERIQAMDKRGPAVNAVIELNRDALKIAAELDRLPRDKRGRLHGIPVLLKDNIDTADAMHTTAGSLALVEAPAPADATVTKRLREAGAVILGKTNLSEWANFRSTHASSGWSGRGGQTRNPYVLSRNPCGSSSGSAVAVTANFCAIAVGTETDGSIVCPASMNGIVGIKPTLGLVSRAGIIPIAHSQDTAGPMARTVRDAAVLLGVLAGIDPRDPATADANLNIAVDYTKHLDLNGLRGARLGVARKFFTMGMAVDRLMTGVLDKLKQLGAEIVDPVELPSHGQYDATELEVLLYEFKADLGEYLRGRGGPMKSLADVMAFNTQSTVEMQWFGQELMEQAQQKGPLTEKAYLEALEKNHRLSRKEGIDAVLAQHKLDAVIAPTAGPAWLTDLVTGDHDTGGCSTPAAVAGYPHITVPAGFVHGLPVGLSFFGTAWSEPVLLRLAYAFEQGSKARRIPGFLRT